MKSNRRQFFKNSAGIAAASATATALGQNVVKVPTCPDPEKPADQVRQPTPDDFKSGPELFRQIPLEPLSTGAPPAHWTGKFGVGCGPCGIAKEFGATKPAEGEPEFLDDDDSTTNTHAPLVTEFGTTKNPLTEYFEIVIQQNSKSILNGPQTQFLGYGPYNFQTPKAKVASTPGPMFQARVGKPMVIRFINQAQDYMSVHLHGGHGPAHSDGHPTFMIPKSESMEGTSAVGYGANHRDYFYPHTVPAKKPELRQPLPVGSAIEGAPGTQKEADNLDYGESPSTMWYHDHSMDITGPHVQMGLAGFFPAFDDHELRLLRNHTLPFCGPKGRAYKVGEEITTKAGKAKLTSPATVLNTVFEDQKRNPLDLCIVLQDRCLSIPGNQILYSVKGHNGHLGHHVLVNGLLKPKCTVAPLKYRLRMLDGSNARIYKLALYARIEKNGEAIPNAGELVSLRDKLPSETPEWFRIGMDTWLYPKPVVQHKVLLAMAKRADMIADFAAIAANAETIFKRMLAADENIAVYLCNLLDQESGRGPKVKLADGNAQELTLGADGQPIAVPNFQAINVDGDTNKGELNTPWPLLKFTIEADLQKHPTHPNGADFKSLDYSTLAELKQNMASVTLGTFLREHTPIRPEEIKRTREVVFERGNGIWQINGKVVDEFLSNFVPELNTAECWILENGGGGWWHPIHIHLESHQQIEYLQELDIEEFKLVIGQIIAEYEQAKEDEAKLGHTVEADTLGDILKTLKETLAPFQNSVDANGRLLRSTNDDVSLQKLTKASVKRLGEFGEDRAGKLGTAPTAAEQLKAYLRLQKAYAGVAELMREFAPDIVFEDHRMWDRVQIPPWDQYKSDTSILGPNSRIKIFMKFRTFDGPFVFHCHNLEHEDMRMMFVFDPQPTPPQLHATVEATPDEAAKTMLLDSYHLREQPVRYRHPWRFSDRPASDQWSHTDKGPPDVAVSSKTPAWDAIKEPPIDGKIPKAHPIWGGWDQHI